MSKFDFSDKTFALVKNSDSGKVTAETVFKYKQEDDLVTADYSGGTIRYGKIIAALEDDELDMLYQCITNENELKAGKAKAKITINDKGKMKLSLDWEWLEGGGERGKSEYIEIE